jgi:5-methylcytosine-specific restriction protein B
MSRYCDLPIAPILSAADRWKQHCLTEGLSIFTDHEVWAPRVFDELKRLYIDAPDTSAASYYDKLKGQLATASVEAKWLMVELTWVLYLFPYKLIGVEGKRRNLELICSNVGIVFPSAHWALASEVLAGIGNPGTFFNTGFWVELSYTLLVFREFMQLSRSERERLIREDDALVTWIDALPLPKTLETGDALNPQNRQARHILLFLMHPDFHERIASSGHKRKIVKTLASKAGLTADTSTPTVMDQQLLAIRNHFQSQLGMDSLDFYRPPLADMWKDKPTAAPAVQEPVATYSVSTTSEDNLEAETDLDMGGFPRNVIFYGPPGTGKTWTLMNRVLSGDLYTAKTGDEPEEARLSRLLSKVGWYEAIAVALLDLGGTARVADIKAHSYLQIKAINGSSPQHLHQLIWGMLQMHTSPASSTVKTNPERRIEPFIFDKDEQAQWSMVSSWKNDAPEIHELYEQLKRPSDLGETVHRYTFVTFHPSYSYEDFIEGLRPVEVEMDDGSTNIQIKPRDGALKRLCKRAISDPKNRYAIVIDEVNRGNIAKIFGELITLIEPDKRLKTNADGKPVFAPGRSVMLPTSQDLFGVPENVDIYGTMNTADRSIALVDIALRRRFVFREILPNPGIIGGEHETGSIPVDDGGNRIDLRRLLAVLNARLTILRGRDACLGHAYFSKITSIDELRATFRDRIIPLLQEYFYEDWEGIALALAVSGNAKPFVEACTPKIEAIFGSRVSESAQIPDASIWRVARSLRPDAPDDDLFPAASFRALYEEVPVAATDLD